MNCEDLLQKPANLASEGVVEGWFLNMAQFLLNRCYLIANSQPYHLAEIEFYCFDRDHPDIFAHRDPLQLQCGLWYFHRNRGIYKSGTYKGLDLTFGEGAMYGGILIRSMETAAGELICGPCLCVDYLLRATQTTDVASLDAIIAGRKAWDMSNILHIEPLPEAIPDKIYATGRVGLTLKRAKSNESMCRYLLRPYRYLTKPKKITKGKSYLIMALHSQGISIEEINKITGSPKKSIQQYISDFEAGKEDDFMLYYGKELSTKDLCRLHGVCA